MSDLPAWAMEKAIKVAQVVLRNLPDDYGDMSLEIGTIARALVAERAAERERCAKIAERQRLWPSSFSLHQVGKVIAATIRKGGIT